jgi:predicted tellurium resistance membrane protein TerC
MDWLTDPQAWVALATLTALEIVLGIDNVVFISILAGKLPRKDQARARKLGLMMAMLMRIALLFSLSWIIRLTAPLFTVIGQEISGRDLVLIFGDAITRTWEQIASFRPAETERRLTRRSRLATDLAASAEHDVPVRSFVRDLRGVRFARETEAED